MVLRGFLKILRPLVILYHLYPRGPLYKEWAAPVFKPRHSPYSNTLYAAPHNKAVSSILHVFGMTQSWTRDIPVESKDATTELEMRFFLEKTLIHSFLYSSMMALKSTIFVHKISFFISLRVLFKDKFVGIILQTFFFNTFFFLILAVSLVLTTVAAFYPSSIFLSFMVYSKSPL